MVQQSVTGSTEVTPLEQPSATEGSQGSRLASSTSYLSTTERTKWLNEWQVAPQDQTAVAPTAVEELDEAISRNGHGPTSASSLGARKSAGTAQDQTRSGFSAVVRNHFLKTILTALDNVHQHAGCADAAPYVNKILHAVRDLDDRSPDDPVLAFLWALYDALTYNAQWSQLSSAQYQKAHQLLLRLRQREELRSDHIEKAIMDLHAAGFETLPFPLSFDEDEQLDDNDLT